MRAQTDRRVQSGSNGNGRFLGSYRDAWQLFALLPHSRSYSMTKMLAGHAAIISKPVDISEGWQIPAFILTSGNAAVGLAFLPLDRELLATALGIFAFMFLGAAATLLFKIFALFRSGEPAPTRAILAWLRLPGSRWAALGYSLAVANITSFLLLKSVLNQQIPFAADEVLADLDNKLFLGHDPWTLITWLDQPIMPTIYHPGWTVLLLVSLVWVFRAPPSRERTSLILAYFALWSLVGPILHILWPAAGPVFYERIGLGDRFVGVGQAAGTGLVADHLWSSFESRRVQTISGISAMPSMHVTMVVWSMLVFYHLGRRWLPLVASFGILIALLSVALGWHYAVDGIVGSISAFLTWKILHRFRTRIVA